METLIGKTLVKNLKTRYCSKKKMLIVILQLFITRHWLVNIDLNSKDFRTTNMTGAYLIFSSSSGKQLRKKKQQLCRILSPVKPHCDVLNDFYVIVVLFSSHDQKKEQSGYEQCSGKSLA